MRKKDNQAHQHNNLSPKMFIISSAFKNFERDRIDSTAVINFNNLIHSISLRLVKNSNQPDVTELFKVTNELIIGFLANYSQQTYRHTCTHSDIINFFMAVCSYFQKAVSSFGISDTIIQSNILNIFWPLFEKPTESFKGLDQNKTELINNLIQNIEQTRKEKVNYDVFVKESYSVMGQSRKKEVGVEEMLVSFLRHSEVVNNFKSTLIKYMTITIAQNLEQNFKKALLIYQHIGPTFEERRLNLQNMLLKTLEYNNCIAFLISIESCMNLSKLITPINLPFIVLRITQKLFSKNNINSNCLKILEELSQINVAELKEVSCEKLLTKGGDNLIIRFLEWVLTRYIRRDNNSQLQALVKQKALQEPQFKEQKFIEFVKKLSIKNSEGDEGKASELKKVCHYFSIFIKNMCKHTSFKEKISIKNVDSLNILNNTQSWSNETIKSFILQVIPPLIEELTFNCKNRTSLNYAIMLRAAEMSAIRSPRSLKSLYNQFKEIYFQMLQSESLNYHYALCFIFLKYEKDRESIRDLIIDSIISDLEREESSKSSRNLILNLSLFLKSFDSFLLSQPIKYKVRHLVKNIDLLANKLQIDQILGVQPKEYINLRQSSIQFDDKVYKMKRLINKELSNFVCKDQLNLFYSLIIAVNEIIELPDQEQIEHSLLTQITSLRKRSMLGELYTNIHLLNEAISEILNNYSFLHPKKIEVFLLLLRLQQISKSNSIKSNDDSELLYSMLSKFLMDINKELDNQLLEKLKNFKNNPSMFGFETYQGYIEDRQIIKFYSESSKDFHQMHIVMCRIGLTILSKLMEMKSISVSSLPKDMQNIFLLYLTGDSLTKFGFTLEHQRQLKGYLLVLLLQEKIKSNLPIQSLLKELIPIAGEIKDVVLDKHTSEHLSFFRSAYSVDFLSICLTAVRKILVSDEANARALFDFVHHVIEEDSKNCSCLLTVLMNTLEQQLQETACQQILNRTKKGLELSSKAAFLEQSALLYKMISKAVEKNKGNLLGLIEDFVQLDCYSDSEQSAFILKEISCIFSNVEERNSEICERIFDYILTLTEIFVGEEKLEISTFICNFFGLKVNLNQQVNLSSLEKPSSLTCTASPNYKCLQCDQKKVICLGCSIVCHENHPICFLNIPIELKFAKCVCSEIGCNTCKLNSKDNPNKKDLLIKPKDFPMYKPAPAPLMGPPPQIYERMKILGNSFNSRYARAEQNLEAAERLDHPNRIQLQSLLRQEELIEQEIRANQWYQNIRRGGDRQNRDRERQEFFSRFGGGRVQRIVDREDYPSSYKMFIEINEGRKPARLSALPQEKQKEKEEPIQQTREVEFVDENYEQQMEEQRKMVQPEGQQNNTILKKYVLLPKFIDLMINFCNKKSEKSKAFTNQQKWKLSFANPQISKIKPGFSFKLHNGGTFTFDIRRQNQINNMSYVLIKKNVAHNHKFLLLASSTEISVFSKEKILNCLSDMKVFPGYNSLSRHSIAFEVHSLDFSPVDKNLFCASGLHNLTLLNISSEGHINRTSFRYNVSSHYINKIKLAKMGVFVGIDKEIRVLNYTCRHFLTIRAHEPHTIIREWAIFQKAAGCQVLFVCPNGNIFTTDILPSDEDKKEFVCRVNDHRANKSGTGASIAGRELPDFGKYLFASFKDGSNILGHLENDQLEDMVNMPLKGLKYQNKKIFDTNFIIGHADLVKFPHMDELYLICTVKVYFPPELSFHQGWLIAIKFKKDADNKENSSEIIVLNDEMTCQFFQVVRVGKRNFFVYSVHTDGSVQITTLSKISKQSIEEELFDIKENEDADSQLDSGENKSAENVGLIRKSLSKHIKLENILNMKSIASSYNFRDGAELLKVGPDYTLIKLNQTDYQFKYSSFNKIMMGFSVPYFGEVVLPTRTIQSTFEVGLTLFQSLYFFAEGSLKFKYRKNVEQKYSRESFFTPNANPRMLERIQRIERLSEYHDSEKLNNHLMSSILGFKEDVNNDVQFLGKSFQLFKAKIPKFQEIFKIESDDESSSIEKTALIIKMFLTKSLKDGNPCGREELVMLIQGTKNILASSSKRLFNLLKEIIVLASKVYQKQVGKQCSVNDENYALRAATENRLEHYFNILKVDISDNELNDFLEFLVEILEEDEDLMSFYVSKYSGIFPQLHRRLKKVDTEQRAKSLIELYTFAYPILKFCCIPCSWILNCICSITFSFFTCQSVRETLYQGIKRSKKISFSDRLKNVCNSQGVIEQADPVNNMPKEQQEEPKDQTNQIYMMYNRGDIDEETLIKMVTEASKLEFERQQENQLALEEQYQEMQPQLQQEMVAEQKVVNHNIALVTDLLDECTDSFSENMELTYSRVMTLYVLSKAIDNYFQDSAVQLLKRMKKMVTQIDIKFEGEKLISVLSYSCLFNRILNNSKYLKKNGGKKNIAYLEIEEQVNQKLSNIRLQAVPKISKPLNLLGKIFKDEKTIFTAHIAYGLANLLLFPCEASHVLLSLECYWLLPESKEFYSKKKDFSNITDGIESGNIQKVYDIAKENPKIWQQYNDIYSKLEFVERWIEEKRHNWELALDLLAIYYQD